MRATRRAYWAFTLIAFAAWLCRSVAFVSTLVRPMPSFRVCSQSMMRLRASAVVEAAESTFHAIFSNDKRPVVLYDGICNMCNRAVDVAIEKDSGGNRLRFAALQSDVGRQLLVFCGRAPDDLSSMIVVKPDGTCLVQSDAALYVGGELEGSALLQGASQVAQALLPKSVRDVAYDALAANRYSVLGQRAQTRLGEEGLEDRFVSL
eukprot:TRINITY_DN108049_c0_g1_i1.p1 TRINITY_DN108049_c0_g1~~TRINITY_DN108049_c0_g1_i1.p1  ORF type:complete len:206 (-),score=23.34 TRINITY_DN108049_c0_g1_i1:389-1006(-)